MSARSLASLRAETLGPSKIRRIVARAKLMPDVVNLAEGQPDHPTPAHIVDAGRDAMYQGNTRYTDSLGMAELREAIAQKARDSNGLPADGDWVVVTVGAMEALQLSILATVDPGDDVLIPDPGYPSFVGHVQMVNAAPVPYRVEPPDFQIDMETLHRALTPRTRAIVLCTPANPTGGVLGRGNLEQVAEVALRHGLVVVADETYEAFLYDGAEHVSIGSLPGMAERTISVFSFSKTYAMTGWRLGYALAHPKLVKAMQAIHEHVILCPSSVSQHAGLAALRGPQDCVSTRLHAYDKRRRLLVQALDAVPGVSCTAPRGAFYAFPDLRGLGTPSDEVAELLLRQVGVATVPGAAFGSRGEGFLRISYSVELERLRQAVGRLQPLLAALATTGTRSDMK